MPAITLKIIFSSHFTRRRDAACFAVTLTLLRHCAWLLMFRLRRYLMLRFDARLQRDVFVDIFADAADIFIPYAASAYARRRYFFFFFRCWSAGRYMIFSMRYRQHKRDDNNRHGRRYTASRHADACRCRQISPDTKSRHELLFFAEG